ncbi:hypothetical protein IT570_10465 [Candidatus Sumerlaeota bacterium]|nr:hypothetical protein [Candidatus Sumerlaeota bacterium]
MRTDFNHSPLTSHQAEDHDGQPQSVRRHDVWRSILYYAFAVAVGLGVLFLISKV